MRTIKPQQERREEILDAAERLFEAKGFDAASTNDILDAVGIARGTLYYHFKSKEEIMDAVVERSCAKGLAAAANIASDRSIPVVDRVFMAIGSAKPAVEDPAWLEEQLHRPQNALLHDKMRRAFLGGLVPIALAVVEEGIAQGVFHTPHPRGSVEMALLYGSAAFDEELFGGGPEARDERARAFLRNLELIFGARPGSMARFEPMLLGRADVAID
jgi:AcrR family transcriptional regulator